MSSQDSKLWKYATQIAKEAVALDRAKQYKDAQVKYTRAAEILLEFMKYNKNPNLQQWCTDRVNEYINRAKQIKDKGKQKVKIGGSGSSKSEKKGVDEGEDGEENGEELSEEEAEMEKSVMGTVLIEKPDVTWDDIGGLPDPKQALREAVVLPLKHPELFKGARKPWSGILIFGPPGCGKTMLAKAAANEINCTFFVADSASIMSKWLGESEKLVKSLFTVARRKSPSIIFFDEIDSMATKRGEQSEGGGERRLKTQLLQEIQGVKGNGDSLLTVMAATNRPWDIDSAFLRRLEKKIYVPLPDRGSRKLIFKYHVRGIALKDDVDFDELAELSEGYSGSDIAIICREAIMRPIRELDSEGIFDKDEKIDVRQVERIDFLETLTKIKPTVGKEELNKFTEWIKEFGG